MSVFYFLLLSLGVMKATEWSQEIMPWTQKPWFVSLISLTLSAFGTTAVLNGTNIGQWKSITIMVGVWGASAIWHGIESLLISAKNLANSNWLASQTRQNLRQQIRGW